MGAGVNGILSGYKEMMDISWIDHVCETKPRLVA